ncbi:MAG: hypothetical protein QM817_36965 [Archangium sp.]
MRVLILLALFALTACGPKTMQARLKDAERLADKASSALDKAEKAGRELEPKDMERALEDAKEYLAAKDSELYPEAQMNIDRYKELAAQVPAVKAAREKKDLDERLNKARDRIVPRVQAMLAAQDALVENAPTKSKCEDLEERSKALKDAVNDDLDLFVKDADFAAWAKSQLKKVDLATDAAKTGRRGLAFLDGPVAVWKDALSQYKDVKGKKDPEDKEKLLGEVRGKYAACSKDAKPFNGDKATKDIAFVMPEGKPQTPSQLIETCDKALKSGEKEWKAVVAASAKAKAAKNKPPPKKKPGKK